MVDLSNLPGDLILRKSRAGDESYDEIFRVHKPRLIALAEQHNLQYEIWQDVVSGAKVLRPGAMMTQVVRKADAGLSRVWVCMDIDRLARPNWRELGEIMDCISRNQVYILTPSRLYDPGSAGDELVAIIQLIFARHEWRKYRERTAVSRDHIIRKEGRYSCGVVPFGYKWIIGAKRFEPDSQQYPAVEYAWSLVRDYGARQIRRMVAERFGQPFLSLSAYARMFRNPFYAGFPCHRHINGRESTSDSSQWVWPEQQGDYAHPVSLEQWHEIQHILDLRLVNRPKTGTADTWARGVLYFTPCGCGMIGSGPQYRCIRHRTHGIARVKVHRVLEAILGHVLSSPEQVDAFVSECRRLHEQANASRGQLVRELSEVQQRLNQRQQQIRRLNDAYSQIADLSDDARQAFDTQVREWSDDVEGLRSRHATLTARLSMPDIDPELLDGVREAAAQFESWWLELPPSAKKAICELVFERVDVDRYGSLEFCVSAIKLQPWFTPIPTPPPELQGRYGAQAYRVALDLCRDGKRISREEWEAQMDCGNSHAQALWNIVRRCFSLPRRKPQVVIE